MAKMPKYYKIHTDGHDIALEPIYEELVPVVRCKDCIGKDTWYKNEAFGFDICGLSGLYVVEDNDFCSYGERKEGDPDDIRLHDS